MHQWHQLRLIPTSLDPVFNFCNSVCVRKRTLLITLLGSDSKIPRHNELFSFSNPSVKCFTHLCFNIQRFWLPIGTFTPCSSCYDFPFHGDLHPGIFVSFHSQCISMAYYAQFHLSLLAALWIYFPWDQNLALWIQIQGFWSGATVLSQFLSNYSLFLWLQYE